jgi:tRNA modification GTPase
VEERVDQEAGRTETIVALASARGRAATAMVRISGPATGSIVERVFRPGAGGRPSPRRAVVGDVLGSEGEVLDRGVAVCYEGPKSYTGEDMAEITVHGSPPVVRAVVDAIRAAGARLAEPGEFTRRALERGKLDLTQAEAVRDLIEAETLEQAGIAARQLRGEVASALGPVAESVVELLADVEAELDFSEDEGLPDPGAKIGERCRAVAGQLDQLVRASRPAARVKEGARVVLLGPPNAGKSSLFNKLVHRERVIVTPEPGTTRDLIEEVTVIEGLPVVLVDGAGVSDPKGLADAEAMRRATAAAGEADLVLEVRSLTAATAPIAPGSLPVFTHRDLAPSAPVPPQAVAVSNVSGEGLDILRTRIAERLEAPGQGPVDTVALASERHRERAIVASEALGRAAQLAETGQPLEMCAIELRAAVRALHEILGHVGPEELLGRIFSRFCIGK